MGFEKIYVLDTNIILNDAHNIEILSDNGKNLIVLPETVIDELDTKKTGFEEINFQAREFGRLIEGAKVLNTIKVEKDNVIIMEVSIKDNIIIHITSFKEYGIDIKEHSILNDRKIIKVAQFSTEYYENKENTFLISDDVMCRTRAISLEVNTQGMVGKKSEEYEMDFIKELSLDSSHFNTLNNKPITDFDKDYTPENYCYSFISTDGNSCYGYIVNERIQLIDESTMWKGMKVKPLNLGQKFAVAGMLDSRFDMVYINAIAGSGKTLLSLASAMRKVDLGQYDKILYIRNSIESLDKGEDVGYLSGNEEKFKIYNYPLYDSLDFIANIGVTKKSKAENSAEERINELITKYQIQTLWVGALRGRSLDNAFVIIDEFQNISKKTMQTILTRVGKNCKVILIGSSNQIDNLYLNKYTNADSVIRGALKLKNEYINIFATKLNKVVRGNLTEFAEKLFTTSLR